MSGGSYDYVCFKIRDIQLRRVNTDPRRAAFQSLLKLVGEAMYAIEWVDSGDKGDGQEHEAIDACFAFLTPDHETIRKSRAFDAMKEMFVEFLIGNEEKKTT